MSDEGASGQNGWRARLEASARDAAVDLRHAAEEYRTDAFTPPPDDRHVRRFAFGLRLPFQLMRLQFRDPERRRRHLRGTLPGALVTLAIGVFIGLEGSVRDELTNEEPPPPEVSRALRTAERSRKRVERRIADLEEAASESTDEARRAAVERQIGELEQDLATLDERMDVLRELPSANLPGGPRIAAEVEKAKTAATYDVRATWLRIVAVLSAVYGTLRVVEWCVLALARDYQDQLSRQLSLLTAVPPDDPERRPRVRLNLRWLWKRVKRWARGFMLILIGVVTFSPLKLVPLVGEQAFTVLVAAWTVHWLAVFALAKTRLAWEYGEGRAPWFMRLERHSLLRWWGPRLWSRLVGRLSRSAWPAVASFERAPFEGVGLALARVVLYVPVVYSILRPVYVVAAQHVVTSRPPPVERAPDAVSQPAEPAPAGA